MREKYIIVYILPLSLLIAFVTLFPMLYSIRISFLQYYPGSPTISPAFVGLKNYMDVFSDRYVNNALFNTATLALCATIIEFVLGFGLALLFNREIVGGRIASTLLLLPMMLTPVVVAIMWKLMFNSSFGVMNYFLQLIRIPPVPWLAEPFTAKITVLIADIWQWTPFTFIILLAGLKSLPCEPSEAARVDGASTVQIFRYVTLPLLRPTILVTLIFRLLDALKLYDVVYVLTYGGPALATDTFTMYIYRTAFKFFHVGYAMALSYVFLILVLVPTILFIYHTKLWVKS